MHVNIGTLHNTPRKNKTIVGLLVGIQIMMQVHGVIHLMVGTGVTYLYAEVSKIIPIHIYRNGINQM